MESTRSSHRRVGQDCNLSAEQQQDRLQTCPTARRSFLQYSSAGFGWLALQGLLGDSAFAGRQRLQNHDHAPKAKNVVFCFMDGGPSHVDTLDPKPMLTKHQGEKMGDRANARKSQASPDRVWRILKPKELERAEAEKIVRRFYGDDE